MMPEIVTASSAMMRFPLASSAFWNIFGLACDGWAIFDSELERIH